MKRKTCVLVYRSYDHHQFNDILFAGTEKQCLQWSKKYVWKDPKGFPACYIDKKHLNKVYTEENEPPVDNSFLLLLKF